MSTKTTLMTGLMGAALLAAPLAKANSIGLEVIADGVIESDVVVAASAGNGGPGEETYVFNGNGWNVNITAQTYPSPTYGTLASPLMDVNTVDASTTGAGTLEIIFAGDSYTRAGGAFLSIGGTTSSTISGVYSAYAQAGSLVTPGATVKAQLGSPAIASTTFGGTPFLAAAYGTVPNVTPYILGQDFLITATGIGNLSFNANLIVPDGGMTLTMLGSALVGLVGIRSKLGRKA
jgi:hypothetical protein